MDKAERIALFKNHITYLLNTVNLELIPCPLGGDTEDCWTCPYSPDYFLLDDKCVRRNESPSQWPKARISEPAISGTNDEIRSYAIYDAPNDSEKPTKENILAVVWVNLAKRNTCDVNYHVTNAENDEYVLSLVIEALRILKLGLTPTL